jgi:hypothetical protein
MLGGAGATWQSSAECSVDPIRRGSMGRCQESVKADPGLFRSDQLSFDYGRFSSPRAGRPSIARGVQPPGRADGKMAYPPRSGRRSVPPALRTQTSCPAGRDDFHRVLAGAERLWLWTLGPRGPKNPAL